MCIINCATPFNVAHTQKVSNSSIFLVRFVIRFLCDFRLLNVQFSFSFFRQFTNFFAYLPHSQSNYLKLKQQIDQNQFETGTKKSSFSASNGMNRLESLWVRDLLVVYLLCKQFLNDNISKCLNTKSSAKLKFVVFFAFCKLSSMGDMDCDVSVTCLSHTCQQKWSNIDSSHGAYPCQTQQTDSLVWSVKIVFFLPSILTKGTIFFNRPLMDSVYMLLIEIVHSKMSWLLLLCNA